jgi:hypothetical protein
MSDNVRRAVAIRPDGTVSLENPPGAVKWSAFTPPAWDPLCLRSRPVPLVPGIDSLVLGEVIVGIQNWRARDFRRAASNLIGVRGFVSGAATGPVGNDLVLSVAVNPPDAAARSSATARSFRSRRLPRRRGDAEENAENGKKASSRVFLRDSSSPNLPFFFPIKSICGVLHNHVDLMV